jgi:parallel beta-helix repeat protein
MFKKTFPVLLMSMLFLSVIVLAINVQPAQAVAQTVYIKADGSITPVGAPIVTSDNITYSFTGDVTYPTYSGIVVQRSNIVIDGKGYTVQGNQANPMSSGIGLNLTNINNAAIKNVNVKSFMAGIVLISSSTNSINGNNITANQIMGIVLGYSSTNSINGNNVTSNGYGISLVFSSTNSINGNNVTKNGYGIYLNSSSTNSVCRNNIAATSYVGIFLYPSCNYNSIIGNNITNNLCGILLGSSSNKIYSNNFINNKYQAITSPINVWDNGYPSGGNYWSDYTGTDLYSGPNQLQTGSDGIGDTSYIVNGTTDTDNYPLMGPLNTFDAGTWNGVNYSVDVMSDSAVSGFSFNATQKTISFSVTGSTSTTGFCRVTIPNTLLGGPYSIVVSSSPPLYLNDKITNGTHTFLYFTYTHSTQRVYIIGTTAVPEFPSTIIILLFIVVSTLAAGITKARSRRKTWQ